MHSNSHLKQFLNHPEQLVRFGIYDYFTDFRNADTEIRRELVKRLTETGGRRERLRVIRCLAQNNPDAEVFAALAQLRPSDQLVCQAISDCIDEMPTEFLEELTADKLQFLVNEKHNAGFSPQEYLDTKKKLSGTATQDLWNQVWEYNEECCETDHSFSEARIGKVVRELCSRPDFPLEDYRAAWLKDYDEECDGYDEVLLCMMAGELRDDEAIDSLLRFVTEYDPLSYVCDQAHKTLNCYNSATVPRRVENIYHSCPDDAHMGLAFALTKNSAVEAETLMLRLLGSEKDFAVKTIFASSLAERFCPEALEMQAAMLPDGYDRMFDELESKLFVSYMVNGIEHRDMSKWLRIGKETQAKIAGWEENLQQQPVLLREPNNKKNSIPAIASSQSKTGRNEQCPCGSGKKYKKCCGK